jgi:hypothetical protein
MIVLGFVLAILGYWGLPALLPECPLRIDNLFGVVGVVFIIAGIILLLLNVFTGRVFGGRRYWW